MDRGPFAATIAVVDNEIAEGWCTRGAQVSVRIAGEEVLALAAGDAGNGSPMDGGTVLRIYCAIKPVTALAVAHLVDAGIVELDAPLLEHLPEVRALHDGQITLRNVMNHTAGLHMPSAVEVELVPPQRRDTMLDLAGRAPGWRVGADAGYSEIVGWSLLGRLLERVTGEPLREHLRNRVLDPLGMEQTWIGMTSEEYRALRPRIGVSFDLRGAKSYPLLLERSERMCTEVNPAHGGYTTASDLSRLYAAVLAGCRGEGDAELPSASSLTEFTSPARPITYDEVLDRPCGHGLGFMTGLQHHAFGPSCSEASFGHSGNVGATFGFGDPLRDLAVGVVFNGVVDPETSFLRRPVLVRSIIRDVESLIGDDAASADAVQVGAEDTAGTRRRRPSRRRSHRRD